MQLDEVSNGLPTAETDWELELEISYGRLKPSTRGLNDRGKYPRVDSKSSFEIEDVEADATEVIPGVNLGAANSLSAATSFSDHSGQG
jgi:hypothetical protein